MRQLVPPHARTLTLTLALALTLTPTPTLTLTRCLIMPGTTRSIDGVTSIRSSDDTVSDMLGQSSLFSIRGHTYT